MQGRRSEDCCSIGFNFDQHTLHNARRISLASLETFFTFLYFVLTFIMPFSKEDKIIIKHYRLDKGYGRKKLLNEFPGKDWSAGGLDKLLRKIDETQSVERKAGSGRPRTARTEENIEIVEELICSREDEPKSHKTPREIARETGISHSSVRRIAKFDLNLTPFKRVKGQKLSAKDEEKRKKRAAKLLRIVLKRSLKKTFFTDEKIFTVDTPRNTQNDRVYADVTKKNEISDERLYTTKSTFPKKIMVSVGISQLGKTSLFVLEPGAKVNGQYYRDELLAKMIPEMDAISGGDYIFQQDGARAHTAKDTIKYIKDNMPDYIPPEMWPPNSPDLNPVDYGIWESFMRKVYKKKISDVETLKTALEEAWEEFPQSEINEIIDQFRKRCNKVKAVKGKHIEQFF